MTGELEYFDWWKRNNPSIRLLSSKLIIICSKVSCHAVFLVDQTCSKSDFILYNMKLISVLVIWTLPREFDNKASYSRAHSLTRLLKGLYEEIEAKF